jgi:hypothetical protein
MELYDDRAVSPAAANGRASRKDRKLEEITEATAELQARSPLLLQVCLALRLSISAPLAEVIAPPVYGGLWHSLEGIREVSKALRSASERIDNVTAKCDADPRFKGDAA